VWAGPRLDLAAGCTGPRPARRPDGRARARPGARARRRRGPRAAPRRPRPPRGALWRRVPPLGGGRPRRGRRRRGYSFPARRGGNGHARAPARWASRGASAPRWPRPPAPALAATGSVACVQQHRGLTGGGGARSTQGGRLTPELRLPPGGGARGAAGRARAGRGSLGATHRGRGGTPCRRRSVQCASPAPIHVRPGGGPRPRSAGGAVGTGPGGPRLVTRRAASRVPHPPARPQRVGGRSCRVEARSDTIWPPGGPAAGAGAAALQPPPRYPGRPAAAPPFHCDFEL
jgi:hypothetical protein